jgi:hypothetical protein
MHWCKIDHRIVLGREISTNSIQRNHKEEGSLHRTVILANGKVVNNGLTGTVSKKVSLDRNILQGLHIFSTNRKAM